MRLPWRAGAKPLPISVVLAVRPAPGGGEGQVGAAAYRSYKAANRAAGRIRDELQGAGSVEVVETPLARPAKGGIKDVYLVLVRHGSGDCALDAAFASEEPAVTQARRLHARGDRVEVL